MRISDWSSDVCSSDLLWISGVVRGDFGESIRIQMPVSQLLADKLPVTLELAVLAMLIALLIDRKSVVSGKSVSVRVAIGGRRLIKKKKDKAVLRIYHEPLVIRCLATIYPKNTK